jgi:hypothetical protein
VIGVLAKQEETWAVREFFQLFKTPWEFCVPGRLYDLVISTLEEIPEELRTRALVIYQSQATSFDRRLGVAAECRGNRTWVEWNGVEFPVYGELAALRADGPAVLRRRRTPEVVACFSYSKVPAARIGFDLFHEIAFLLSEGQPPENARIPTLDLHISLLRNVIVRLGVSFVEVPPVPAGYDFAACLTHDVDFVGIRDHKCDHTMWGFLYRALIGSLLRSLRGRQPWARCFRNWAAAWSLPLVHLGLREDFWLEFDRYLKIERELGSTFFFIPFKNIAGVLDTGPAPRRRAARYDFAGMKEHVVRLLKSGCEIGLHGIDAWRSSANGKAELQRIRDLTGQAEIGTRVHWLYWNGASARVLEEAGASYDSTFGYNDAVGFRAGTTQPFCPPGAERMLELPLNIQDTAMFYSDRMMLSETEALAVCSSVIQSAVSFGGVLTLNWHTRSLSPERLWGGFYGQLLEAIRGHRVRFGRALEIIAWFRKRRALRFDTVACEGDGRHVVLSSPAGQSDPPFTVRVHYGGPISGGSSACERAYTDHHWNGENAFEVSACEPAIQKN